MNECTERARIWPDEPADVSPDELDAFLAHARADVCPFHAEKLRAEEEELRSMFRLARGLDSHGRILRGRELKNTIAEHRRRQARWKEAARIMTLPFKRIYLSNCGEDIAGSGKFYDFRRYEGDHSLEPEAGLQVWGVLSDERGIEKVLLGFYPLAGVEHTGEETFIPLVNGYTVGLKVLQLDERLFNIEFRCVENEVLEKERTEVQEQSKKKGAAAGATAGTSFFITRFSSKARSCLVWLIPSRERLVPQTAAGILACLIITATVKVALTSDRSGLPETPPSTEAPTSSEPTCDIKDRSPSAAFVGAAFAEPTPAVNKSLRQGITTKSQPTSRRIGREAKQPRASSAITEPELLKTRAKDVLAGNTQEALRSATGSGAQTENRDSKRQSVWYLQSRLSGTDAAKWFILHTGKDAALMEKLFAEIQQCAFDIAPLSNNISHPSASQQLTVAWDITREEKFVTVQAVLTTSGESRVLSFGSGGSCQEQACERAVKAAVSGVYAVVQRELAEKAEG